MKKMIVFSGILGLIFAVLAQLFAVTDDSYTLGDIWFLGVLAGILTMITSMQINKKNACIILLIISSFLGIIGTGTVYSIPTVLNVVLIYKLKTESKWKSESMVVSHLWLSLMFHHYQFFCHNIKKRSHLLPCKPTLMGVLMLKSTM